MKRLGIFLKNTVQSIFAGTFLLRLHITGHFAEILVCIMIAFFSIWVSMRIDNTLTQVKKNDAVLKEQRYQIDVRQYKLNRLDSRIQVEKSLENMGSDLRQPQKPATRITEHGKETDGR